MIGAKLFPPRLPRWLFSAPALLLLTAGILWGTWSADVTRGDTANHFRRASQWLQAGPIESNFLATSPLYTVYFAAVHAVVRDVAATVYLHRVLIVLASAVAFLALARRVLPRPWAWFIAAWWVALPINWRAEYEVHYFGFVFLAAAGALAGGRTLWHRGLALAVLAVFACYLRNEYAPALGLFGLYCLALAWREPDRYSALAKTVAPAVIAVLALAWALSGGPKHHPWRTARAGFENRHRINMLQVYALGYIQRHDDWKGDPWEASSLLERDFGHRRPTFGEAMRANPRAVLEHVLWNFRLIPAGLQLGLFARFGDSPAPDFAGRGPERTRNPWPLTSCILALWGGGAWLLLRYARGHRRPLRCRPGAKAVWVYLLCGLPTVAIAIVTQRPRPNYIFPLLLLLMLFTGVCGRMIYGALRRRLSLSTFGLRYAAPAAALLLMVVLAGRNRPAYVSQPTLDDVRRLETFKPLLTRKNGRLATNAPHTMELGSYTGMNLANKHTIRALAPLLTQHDQPFAETLAAAQVTELFLKSPSALPPAVQAWRGDAAARGPWVKRAEVQYLQEDWEFWSRAIEKPPRN